jgi:hypothetical protein
MLPTIYFSSTIFINSNLLTGSKRRVAGWVGMGVAGIIDSSPVDHSLSPYVAITLWLCQQFAIEKMAPYSGYLPIKNGWIFHSYVTVYQRL